MENEITFFVGYCFGVLVARFFTAISTPNPTNTEET